MHLQSVGRSIEQTEEQATEKIITDIDIDATRHHSTTDTYIPADKWAQY